MQLNKKQIFILITASLVMLTIAYLIYLNYAATSNLAKYGPAQIADVEVISFAEPSTELPESSKINISSSFSRLSKLPKTAYIYSYTPKTHFQDPANISNIIASLQVNQLVKQGAFNSILATRGNKALAINKQEGYLSYTNQIGYSDKTAQTLPINPDLSIYRSKAENFVSTLGINLSKYKYDKFHYLSIDGGHTKTVSVPQQAEIIEFIYNTNINGTPVIDQEEVLEANSLRIWIDKNFDIRKILVQDIGTIGTTLGTYPLKSIKQLERDIIEGKAKIIDGDPIVLGEEVVSVIVNKAELEYLAIKDKLIPIYVLSAKVTIANNTSGKARLLIEAIDKEKLR